MKRIPRGMFYSDCCGVVFYFNLSGFFPSFFGSEITRLSNFLISSSAGSSSGLIPLFNKMSLTPLLLVMCSAEIFLSECKPFYFVLNTVISVAKSFAFIVIVGKKSARALPFGTPSKFFIFLVDFPKRAWSPLLLISPKSLSFPVFS